MGSKSSASSASTNNTRNVDQSIVDSSNGDGSRTNTSFGGDVSGSVTINTSDFGAIKAAESVSEKAFDFAKDSNSKAFTFASDSQSQAGDLAASALQATRETASESVSKFANLAEQVKTDGAAQTKKLIATVLIALALLATVGVVVMAINKGKTA